MSRPIESANKTLTLRLEERLKDEFLAVAEEEKRPASELLREFMRDHIARRRREQFDAQAARESALLAASFSESQEKELLRWFDATWRMEDWTWED